MRAAASRSRPRKRPVVIVTLTGETPGARARAWAMPMYRPWRTSTSASPSRCGRRSAHASSSPPAMRRIAICQGSPRWSSMTSASPARSPSATVPAVTFAGGVRGGEEHVIEDHLGEPWQIAILLIAGGLLLARADRRPQREGLADVDVRQGLYIGIAQALALAPGVSSVGDHDHHRPFPRPRSRRCGTHLVPAPWSRSRPAQSCSRATGRSPTGCPTMWRARCSWARSPRLVGYLAIAGLLALVRRRSYDIFVVYRVLVGVLVLALIATGVQSSTF